MPFVNPTALAVVVLILVLAVPWDTVFAARKPAAPPEPEPPCTAPEPLPKRIPARGQDDPAVADLAADTDLLIAAAIRACRDHANTPLGDE